MPAITVGGLATGLNTNSIIDQLVKLERRSVTILEDERLSVSAQQSAYQSLNSKLLAFKSAADDLRDNSKFLSQAATSSDETVVEAAAGTGASAGTTAITVTSLAQGAIATSSVGKSASTDTIASGTGSFAFKVGSGTTQTVSIDSTTTLSDLATSINNLSAGVTASAINLGTTSSPDYRLQIVSNSTGSSNDITIVTDGTNISISSTQNASNATFTISGFATALTRESNSFSDVIPGVTISLKTTGSATVTVDNDLSAISANVQNLVDKFNEIVSFINSESAIVQDPNSQDREAVFGPLAADGTVLGIVNRLHDLIASTVSGLSGTYSNLSQVGIKTQQDGTLSFDSSKLTSAIGSDAAGVAELFGGSATTTGASDRLYDYVNQLTQTGGIIDIREKALEGKISSLDKDIDNAERGVASFKTNLRATFTNLEILVSGLQSQSTFLVNALLGGGR